MDPLIPLLKIKVHYFTQWRHTIEKIAELSDLFKVLKD